MSVKDERLARGSSCGGTAALRLGLPKPRGEIGRLDLRRGAAAWQSSASPSSASAIATRNVRQISLVRLRAVLQRVGEHAEIEPGEKLVQALAVESVSAGPRPAGD